MKTRLEHDPIGEAAASVLRSEVIRECERSSVVASATLLCP